MKLTKFDHSTFYLEKDGRGILFDPVEYTAKLPVFNNLDAIIITHKHGDHFQPETLQNIRENNPNTKVYTTADNSESIADSIVAKPGQQIEVGNFTLNFFGSNQHAPIYNREIPCENLGVIVDGILANPGDSFDPLPNNNVKVLLVPISAPWLKVEDAIKYVETIRPEIAINAHDALLSKLGLNITNSWLNQKSEPVGTKYQFLLPGENIEF